MPDTLIIPKDLRGHLPRVIEEFATSKTVVILYCGLFVLLLYGATNYHNVWLYTVPTLIGPLLPAFFFMFRPLNPYKSVYAKIEGMEGLDRRNNVAAQHLVALLRSRQAISVSLRTGIISSLVLCFLEWGFSFIRSRPLQWTFDVDGVVLMTFLFGVMSQAIHYRFLLQWAFRSWGNEK